MRGFLKIAGVLGLLGGLVILEHRRPLRAEKESFSAMLRRRFIAELSTTTTSSTPLRVMISRL